MRTLKRPPPRGTLWILFAAAAVTSGQTLDLAQALRLADSAAFSNRMAVAREQAAAGADLAAWAGFAPNARIEAGFAATTDPLGAFGTRLGQRRVAMESFAPASLNDPDAIVGLTTSLVAEVPLLNVDAWHGKRAASLAHQAARLDRALEQRRVRGQVIEAWTAVGLARAAVGTWESALAVAMAYERQAAAGQRQETAIRSDVLRARVEVATLRASLSKARTDILLAEQHLALLLGGNRLPGSVPALDGLLTDSGRIAAAARTAKEGMSPEAAIVERRAEAARADWCRTRDALLPRVNGMARVDWKEHASMFEKDPSWSVGVLASWDLPGPRMAGAAREAHGRWREAEAGRDALVARNALERASLRARVIDALGRLQTERGALEQATEAHRIATRRHEEGVATLTERIEGGALETKIRLEIVALRQEIVPSLVRLALLDGRDPADLPLFAAKTPNEDTTR